MRLRRNRPSTSAVKLAAARTRAARGVPAWTELDPLDLVPRGDLFVSVETDRVFKPHPGVVFEKGSTVMVADQAPLFFTVTDGQPVFLERVPGTWSAQVARRDHRDALRRVAS